jgi:hypothetical protein
MTPERPSWLQRLAERIAAWAELRVEQGERERIVRVIQAAKSDYDRVGNIRAVMVVNYLLEEIER